MVQELLFYRVRSIPALRYFRNTVLMTHKSQLSMTMRVAVAVKTQGGSGDRAAEADLRGQPWVFLMFPSKEAGLLRSLLLVLKWAIALGVVAAAIWLGAAYNQLQCLLGFSSSSWSS